MRQEYLGQSLATYGNRFDHYAGQLLTVTVLAPGLFLGAHFVNDDLGAAAMGHHLELNAGSLDVRLAESGGLAIAAEPRVGQTFRFHVRDGAGVRIRCHANANSG